MGVGLWMARWLPWSSAALQDGRSLPPPPPPPHSCQDCLLAHAVHRQQQLHRFELRKGEFFSQRHFPAAALGCAARPCACRAPACRPPRRRRLAPPRPTPSPPPTAPQCVSGSPILCQTCKATYTNVNNVCVSNTQCTINTPNCAACDAANPNLCAACKAGFDLDAQNQVVSERRGAGGGWRLREAERLRPRPRAAPCRVPGGGATTRRRPPPRPQPGPGARPPPSPWADAPAALPASRARCPARSACPSCTGSASRTPPRAAPP